VSKETVRRWMVEAGLWKANRRRVVEVHQWRARRSRCGELVLTLRHESRHPLVS
jgi:hypothetical protein